MFTRNSLSLSFSAFSARRNRFAQPARDIKWSVKAFIHSNAIPKCVFVNNNDTKISEENNHIVRLVEQPSSTYFRSLAWQKAFATIGKFTTLLIEKVLILKISRLSLRSWHFCLIWLQISGSNELGLKLFTIQNHLKFEWDDLLSSILRSWSTVNLTLEILRLILILPF